MDIDNDSLGTAFTTFLDTIDFLQCVNEPTHINHTLDHVLAYGIETEHIIVFPQNAFLSDKANISVLDVCLTVLYFSSRNVFSHRMI